MRILGILLLLICQLLSFAEANSHSAISRTMVVEYSHTHGHDQDHHSMNDHDDSGTTETHDSKPHKHEVYLGSHAAFIQSEIFAVSYSLESSQGFLISNEKLPQGPYLLGIFRPPISA